MDGWSEETVLDLLDPGADLSVEETVVCSARQLLQRKELVPKLLAFSTLVPFDFSESDSPAEQTLLRPHPERISVEQTLIRTDPKQLAKPKPRAKRPLLGLALGLSLASIAAAPLAGGALIGAALFGAALIGSSGARAARRRVLDDLRATVPALIVPIERIEVFAQAQAGTERDFFFVIAREEAP